jgi:hypothetical protein
LAAAVAADLVLTVVACGAPVGDAAARDGGPIQVTARPVALDAGQPERSAIGHLRFRGALTLSSPDDRFGGISDLIVAADGGTFVAVSDGGYWLRGRLLYEAEMLAGVAEITLEPLRGPDGRAVESQNFRDAEALTRLADGTLVVAFERDHRLWAYRRSSGGRPAPIPPPRDLARAPNNGGIEALTMLADGRLLAISEAFGDGSGVHAWLTGNRRDWALLRVAVDGGFRPTGATTLPSGDVLVVERRFPPIGARIHRIPAAAIRPDAVLAGDEIARLEGSLTVDNMEAIAARKTADGGVLVYLASDDNYNPLQQTLLMMFELVE